MILKSYKNSTGLLFFLYGLVFAAMIWSLQIGRVEITLPQIVDCIKNYADVEAGVCPPLIGKVLVEIRVPRIILAVLVGGALAVSGGSYQTLFKNPLVSPSILGVSSGAAFGAALAMVLNGTWWEIQLLALVFGLAAVGCFYFWTQRADGAHTRGSCREQSLWLSAIHPKTCG